MLTAAKKPPRSASTAISLPNQSQLDQLRLRDTETWDFLREDGRRDVMAMYQTTTFPRKGQDKATTSSPRKGQDQTTTSPRKGQDQTVLPQPFIVHSSIAPLFFLYPHARIGSFLQ
jgi:hypothetical protein